MKRILLFAACILLFAALSACGKRPEGKKEEEPQVKEPPVSQDEAFNQAEMLVEGMTLEEKVGQMLFVSLRQIDNPSGQRESAERVRKKAEKAIGTYQFGGILLDGAYGTKSRHYTSELADDLQQAACQPRQAVGQLQQSTGQLQQSTGQLQQSTGQLPQSTGQLPQDEGQLGQLAQSASGGALFIAMEEEGGGSHSVSVKNPDLRAGGYATPAEMGESMSEQMVYARGKSIGKELDSWEVNLNLAPVADLASGNNEDYDARCFGSDADTVSDLLARYVEGMREGGVAVTLKHFPGIGSSDGDYTKEILKNDRSLIQLRSDEFSVYQAGIDAGADCVMMSSAALTRITGDETPSFLSEEIVTGLLREELGFEGVVMTPPLNTPVIREKYTPEYAAVEAVKAGCDMIVMPSDIDAAYNGIIKEVRTGRLSEKVINTAVRRILQCKIHRGILVLKDK